MPFSCSKVEVMCPSHARRSATLPKTPSRAIEPSDGWMSLQRLVVLALGVLATTAVFAAPDEDVLGKAQGYPIGNRSNWFYDEAVRVGSFSQTTKFDGTSPT